MAQLEASVQVLENCRVPPPSAFIVPQPSHTLTFFDVRWLPLRPVQRLFFYHYPHDKTYFMENTLRILKYSLSLTVQHFYPLAGTLIWPTESAKPQVQCSEDDLAVTLTVAESSFNFNKLVGNHAREVNEFYPLVPQLPLLNTRVDMEVPVMALQVTLFPNFGISIGISNLHVVADGKTTTHFMKSWASVCKSGLGDSSCLLPESLPFYNRRVIDDPNNLEATYINNLARINIDQRCFYKLNMPPVQTDKVRATFVLGQPEIQKIKRLVVDRLAEKYHKDAITRPPLHLSSFVLTCAYVWVCLIKVLTNGQEVDGMETEDFAFTVDCRQRMSPPIPATYFGNCLMTCFGEVRRSDLIGEDGIAISAEAIGNSIQKMFKEGVLAGAESLFSKLRLLVSKQRFLTIAGSPKLGVYDADFGWGMPKKVEVISIDSTTGAISLSECGDGEGGTEIGLVLNKLQMDAFAYLFTNTHNILS